MAEFEFDFVDGDAGGQFVLMAGPMVQLRQLLARGEVDAAVRLYEDTGAVAREQLLTEAESASFDTQKNIAHLLRRSREFGAAARVFRKARLEAEAAATFEQAEEFAEAAASWAKAGEILKAAAAYERANQIDAALALYRKAGAGDRAAECLARGKRYLEAAREFRGLNNAHAEFEALRAAHGGDPANVELVSRLAELMFQHGRKEQAGQLLVDLARRTPAAMNDTRFATLLAAGLDAMGQSASAHKVRARIQGGVPAAAQASAPALSVTPAAAPKTELGADAYGFLKALPMFAELSFDDMKALYRVCVPQAYQVGQHLIEIGQAGPGLFLMIEGIVDVYAGVERDARLLNTVGAGAYVGEISLVQEGPTSARVTARTPLKVLFISRLAFHQYVFSSPIAALKIYQLFTYNLAGRVRALSSHGAAE